MKKIICLTALTLVASAGLAFANTDVTTSVNPKFSASSNVKVFAAANATQFAASSKHLNGTRTYGVTSISTQIVYTETTGAGVAITGQTASDSSGFSGWSSM